MENKADDDHKVVEEKINSYDVSIMRVQDDIRLVHHHESSKANQ